MSNRFKLFKSTAERRWHKLVTTAILRENTGENASDWWRTLDPFDVAKHFGHECWASFRNQPVVHPPDILVLRGEFLNPNGLWNIQAFLAQCEADKVLIVTDWDDDYYALDANKPLFDRIPAGLMSSHVITTTTKYLADQVISLTGHDSVYVVPNAINLPRWAHISAPKLDEPIVCIVGSTSHASDWELIPDVFSRLAERHPDVRFRVCGTWPTWANTLGRQIGSRLEVRDQWTSFNKYPTLLEGAHIILQPLEDTALNRGRSPNRFLEATAAGAAFIGSPLVYSDVVQDGFNGFLANDADTFVERASVLLSNQNDRERMVSLARQTVFDHALTKEVVDARFNVYYTEWQRRYGDGSSTVEHLSEASTGGEVGVLAGVGGWGAPANGAQYRPWLSRDDTQAGRGQLSAQPSVRGRVGIDPPERRAAARELWTPGRSAPR